MKKQNIAPNKDWSLAGYELIISTVNEQLNLEDWLINLNRKKLLPPNDAPSKGSEEITKKLCIAFSLVYKLWPQNQ